MYKQFQKTFYFIDQIDPMNRKQVMSVLVYFCHTKLGFQEEKNILGTSLWKSKTTHAAKKSFKQDYKTPLKNVYMRE